MSTAPLTPVWVKAPSKNTKTNLPAEKPAKDNVIFLCWSNEVIAAECFLLCNASRID